MLTRARVLTAAAAAVRRPPRLLRATGLRCTATSSTAGATGDAPTSSPPPPLPPSAPSWVRMMNDAIERFPVETMVLYVASDISAIFFAYNLVDAAGYAGDADLALALALSRVVRRVRLPLDIAVAAVLARAYPPLAQVHISRLFSRSAGPAAGPLSAQQRLLNAAKRVADQYGIAFLAAQRMLVGLASTGGVYLALKSGVDVQGALSTYGFELAGSAGQLAGRYAAAMCVAALAFPGVVLGTGFLASRVVGPWRLRMAAAQRAGRGLG